MFKFIHAADIHLDSPLRGKKKSADQDSLSAIFQSPTRKAFKNLINLAIDQKVSLVILAGDLYDGDWKDYNTGLFLINEISRLSKYNIKVFAVAGNHDAANKMTKTLTLPKNMRVFGHTKPETIRLEKLRVALHGQSYANQAVTANLATQYPNAVPGWFNIGVLHTSLDGREGHARYAPCSLDNLRSKSYDYWALGHVHKREVVCQQDPCVVFSGCIQGRHIRETEAKGVTLVTVKDDKIYKVEHKSVDVLRWFVCEVDVSQARNLEDVLQCVSNSIVKFKDKAQNRHVILRIRLIGVSAIASELSALTEQLDYEIRACAKDSAINLEMDLSIEKIKNDTKPPKESCYLDHDQAIQNLLKAVRDPKYNIDKIPQLMEKIAQLKKKLPSSLYTTLSSKDNNHLNSELLSLNTDSLNNLVDQGKIMLEGMLTRKGQGLDEN